MSFDKLVTKVALDLFSRRVQGHTGEIAYQNGGGKLFAQFTHANKNYYPYHGEISLLSVNRDAIAANLQDVEHAIVVGPGPASSFSRKEYPILEKLPNLKAVSLIDLSADFNAQAQGVLNQSRILRRRIKSADDYEMDFRDAGAVVPAKGKAAVFLTGGLVTNLHNAPLNGFPDQDMQSMLTACRDLAGDDGYVILGYDTNQWYDSLEKAYDQSLAPFMKNIMQIIADHTTGINGFDPHPNNFRYEMQWHKKASQVAHNLVFTKSQRFSITEANGYVRNFAFDIGDELLMMSSIKPLPQKMTQLAGMCGLVTANGYFDQHGLVEHIFKSAPRHPVMGPPSSSSTALMVVKAP
ncbi:MAG: L-histidine N(alpha)-methyltransferase [Micavibrio aeruginosavorus]|uniref:L-histidine N(Alpha)-methyltransferase n=1 Tax=Micavibrio aeruginosavorus TaxID=349221 RepID=A0A7T5R3Q4_9BACT|nr:MAG: L-histidine N(alpha)-methyltransferase [Micavibrio aeruginosavorus]